MGRPRRFDAAEVEEAVLGVFWSRGYAGTSIEELTEATGLLRGSLYAAFGSKEDMFRAAMKRYSAHLVAAFSTEKTGLDGVQHALETVVRLTTDDAERRGCLILNAVPESHPLSAETNKQLQDGLKAMRALLRRRLREAQADAGTDFDLEPLAAMLFASSVAIRVLGRAGCDRRLLEDIATGATDAARHRFEPAKTTQPKE
jgi:TetR/AcrR family transcriptional regulator, transcriptional repressor for nem operon